MTAPGMPHSRIKSRTAEKMKPDELVNTISDVYACKLPQNAAAVFSVAMILPDIFAVRVV